MPSYESWSAARGAEIIAEEAKQDGATLPILHALQHEFGYVPREAVPMVAQALNCRRAEVHGVVSVLSRFPRGAGGPPCPEIVPRRGVPVDGRRRAASTRAG